MKKISIIHAAGKAGAEDGMNFRLNDYEFTMNVFAHQFDDERARDAYRTNFLASVGRRLSPANNLRVFA